LNRVSFTSMWPLKRRLTLDEKCQKAKTDIYGWLNESFGHYGEINWVNHTYLETSNDKFDIRLAATEKHFRIAVFLGDNRYVFSVTIREDGKNYLGGSSTTTKYVVGEDWNRGNDLPDGEFSKEVFDSIIKAILSIEFKPIKTRSGKIEIGGDLHPASDTQTAADPARLRVVGALTATIDIP